VGTPAWIVGSVETLAQKTRSQALVLQSTWLDNKGCQDIENLPAERMSLDSKSLTRIWQRN
jgi:hypothetical protein